MDRPQYTKLREIVGGHHLLLRAVALALRRPPVQLLRSEDQLQSELHDAIVAGLQTAVAADIVRDLPEVGRIVRQGAAEAVGPSATGPGSGRGEIHMVRKIECFRTHLKGLTLA